MTPGLFAKGVGFILNHLAKCKALLVDAAVGNKTASIQLLPCGNKLFVVGSAAAGYPIAGVTEKRIV